jgi:hypothetical protein
MVGGTAVAVGTPEMKKDGANGRPFSFINT